ncbi:U32 family peptidase [Erysipelotrichaceae bacterium OH741_COT-311]|nr:U32 family peptidase [Erysipelotrichaceae bacterium OH741_COT-311]
MELIVTLSSKDILETLKEKKIDGVIVGEAYFANRLNHYFTKEEMLEIHLQCKQLGLKYYVLINRMIEEPDLMLLESYLKTLKTMGVDGIYYNDLAVLHLARKLEMLHLLSFNPDTLMTNKYDVNFYLQQGTNSVVISKEITLEEIIEILDYNPGKCDYIIHGRLNLSYTKRPFIKNYLKHIDSNYGVVYNQRYDLIESTRQGSMPAIENEHGTSVFTEFTLAGFKEMLQMKEKINRFIIDDIFMSQQELFDVLDGYQAVLQKGDPDAIFKRLSEAYPDSHYHSGYMYLKTNLVR